MLRYNARSVFLTPAFLLPLLLLPLVWITYTRILFFEAGGLGIGGVDTTQRHSGRNKRKGGSMIPMGWLEKGMGEVLGIDWGFNGFHDLGGAGRIDLTGLRAATAITFLMGGRGGRCPGKHGLGSLCWIRAEERRFYCMDILILR